MPAIQLQFFYQKQAKFNMRYRYSCSSFKTFYNIIVAHCHTLEPIPNGRYSFSQRRLGDVVTFECDRGFRLIGNNTRTCQSNRRFSGTEPRCKGNYVNKYGYRSNVIKTLKTKRDVYPNTLFQVMCCMNKLCIA